MEGRVMRKHRTKWSRGLIVLGAFAILMLPALMPVSSVSAELSEAEKQALEAEQQAPEPPEAPEPAAPPEAPEPAAPPEAPEPAAPPESPEPAAPPEAPEAPEAPEPAAPPEAPEAPEAPEPAAPPEPPEGGQDQGQGNNPPTTDALNGYIYAIGTDTLTVGIIEGNTVTVTGQTYITYNGHLSNLPRLFIGDTVSVTRDLETGEAVSIEAEGKGFQAIYQGVGSTITYIGMIGHVPGAEWGMHAGGIGGRLGPATQVTVNGVPATYMDLQVGDTIDFAESSVDLTVLWIIVTR